MAYVYLLWAENTCLYKIGMGENPKRRLKECQIGNPYKLELLAFREVKDASRVETALHQKYADHRKRGEWFEFHPLMLPHLLNDFGCQTNREKQFCLAVLGKIERLNQALNESRKKGSQNFNQALNLAQENWALASEFMDKLDAAHSRSI